MDIEQAKIILMKNRPEKPRTTEKKQLQQAIDVILKDQTEAIMEALRELRTDR